MSTPRTIRPSDPAFGRLALLREHSLFREFAPAVIERLGSYMTRRTLPRGSVIFSKGDPGSGLIGVLAGRVKISVLSTAGREAVLNIINPGEVFGEIALLDGGPRSADATAISDCELMVIDRRDFVPFLRSQPDIALKFIEILCARLRHTSEQVEDVMFLNLPARLAKTLLRLAPDSGASSARVAITQREMAQLIGTSRESINKQLRAWARYKWVKLERGEVRVLASDALAKVAADRLSFDPS